MAESQPASLSLYSLFTFYLAFQSRIDFQKLCAKDILEVILRMNLWYDNANEIIFTKIFVKLISRKIFVFIFVYFSANEIGQGCPRQTVVCQGDETQFLWTIRCRRKPSRYQTRNTSNAFFWSEIHPGLFRGGGYFRGGGWTTRNEVRKKNSWNQMPTYMHSGPENLKKSRPKKNS